MQFKKKIITAVLIGSGINTAPSIAYANDSVDKEQLRALVEELVEQRVREITDQKIRILERKNELAAEDAAKQKSSLPIVKASEKGFGLESADGKFKFKIGALFQGDARYIDTDIPGNTVKDSDYLLRRAEVDFQATVFDKYDFRLLSEFQGPNAGVLDAYLDARFTPEFKVKFGKFKIPGSLERLQGGGALKFVDRAYVADALLPNRDTGLQVHGDLFKGKFNYAAGVFDGQVDGQQASNARNDDSNSKQDFIGRVFVQPFKGENSALAGLSFGISGTWGDVSGSTGNTNLTTGYNTPGRLPFFKYRTDTNATNTVLADGDRIRLSPQGYYTNGPFFLLAEYAQVKQDVVRINGVTRTHDDLNHDAWQIAASWLLTGENNSFGAIKPNRPFDLDKGGLGAWEVALRYSELNVDDATFKGGNNSFAELHKSAKSAESWALGLNWHLNDFVKFAGTYEHTKFDGGAGTALAVKDRDDEDVLSARFQLAF